jgi:hypothetical protein
MRGAVPQSVFVLVLATLMAACSTPPPGASVGAVSLFIAPGRPYSQEEVLAILQKAAVTDPAFDDRLARLNVAAPLADAITTIDGKPYGTVDVLADCNSLKCGLSIVGHPKDDPDRGSDRVDRWTASVLVDRGPATMFPALAELRGYPARFDSELDALVRALVPVDGLAFREGRWLLPPAVGFELRYEDAAGTRGIAVTVDPATKAVSGIRVYDPSADILYLLR